MLYHREAVTHRSRRCLLQFSHKPHKRNHTLKEQSSKKVSFHLCLPPLTVANRPRPPAKGFSAASAAPHRKVRFIFRISTRPHLAPSTVDSVHSATWRVVGKKKTNTKKPLRSAGAANVRGRDCEQQNKAGLGWLQCGLALNTVWNNNV